MAKRRDPRQLPSLPEAFQEIVARLLDDDWSRHVSDDGTRVYYIIGDRWSEDEEQPPPVSFQTQSPRVGVVARGDEHLARATLSSAAPLDTEYERVFGELRKSGIDPDEVLAFFRSLPSLDSTDDVAQAFPPSMVGIGDDLDKMKAVLDLFSLDIAESTLDEDGKTNSAGPLRVREAAERIHLKEIAERYKKIIARIGRLDAVPVSEPQLAEATRCFVYGFYRGAIVLGAAALEMRLKEMTEQKWLESYRTLVDNARAAGYLGSDSALVDACNAVFDKRHLVVHKGHQPDHDEAHESLVLVRKVITHLADVTPSQSPGELLS